MTHNRNGAAAPRRHGAGRLCPDDCAGRYTTVWCTVGYKLNRRYIMKVYYGTNTGPGPQVVYVAPKPGAKPYRLRHHYRHSRDGFQWGYGGSGPSDLARSILIDLGLPTTDVERLYGPFKAAFIATAGGALHVRECDIRVWIDEHDRQVANG